MSILGRRTETQQALGTSHESGLVKKGTASRKTSDIPNALQFRQDYFEMSRPNTSARLGVPNGGTPNIRQRNPLYIPEASSSRLTYPQPRGTDRKGKGKEKEKVKGRWEVGTKGWVKDGFRQFGAHCARNQVSLLHSGREDNERLMVDSDIID